MRQTSFEEVQNIASSGDYRVIPIRREILADVRTPLNVLRALQNVSDHCFLLESAEDSLRMGRYTFLGYDPRMELTCRDHVLTIRSGGEIRMETEHPAAYIRQILDENRAPSLPGMPTLTGGLVGFFSYDYIQYGEPSLKFKVDENRFDDLDLMLFDKMIAFDNYRQVIELIVNIRTDSLEVNYNHGVIVLDEMQNIVENGKMKDNPGGRLLTELKPHLSKEAFCEKVAKIKHYIHEGDIFQLVFSNPITAKFEGSLLDTYRILRTTNPSPYMFYFSGSTEIAGASPETLVKVNGRTIRTFPLAGTRKRGETPEEDEKLERELLADEKERAEHNMLVDLGRNDLGRLCTFGSVEVEKYMEIERYSHVMHIGSAVRGTLREEIQAVDAVDAVLPAGTLSGAPKIRACQLIDELEDDRRGIYGGAIGYVDFTGNLDVCIGIRLAYKKDGILYIRSGAGIVADSVPENEYQECINKAAAVTDAVKEAERMRR
ncbi:MAG: anthranilate synthase component I family protein [Lachnospiraceae bacterium]|jgi:anthranilate synthase component 1|nr:anthranilate synthase component I family protein [Lachnospiraceae bacterium]MCI1328807.1 anthranilate synthase component I family protein [Lachnospiraceae bacterium]